MHSLPCGRLLQSRVIEIDDSAAREVCTVEFYDMTLRRFADESRTVKQRGSGEQKIPPSPGPLQPCVDLQFVINLVRRLRLGAEQKLRLENWGPGSSTRGLDNDHNPHHPSRHTHTIVRPKRHTARSTSHACSNTNPTAPGFSGVGWLAKDPTISPSASISPVAAPSTLRNLPSTL